MADGTGGVCMRTPGCVVWLGKELNGLCPAPPRNDAIPMGAERFRF